MSTKPHFFATIVAASLTIGLIPATRGADPIDFSLDVKPLLEGACVSCHKPGKTEGELNLTSGAAARQGGENGTVLVPGKPADSRLYTLTVLPADHDDIMPPKGGPLHRTQTEVLRQWIEQGAEWPETELLKQTRRISFVRDVRPILELNCVACHREGHVKGGLRLDTRESAFQGGDNGVGLVAFRPKKSSLYTSTTLSPDDDDLMPPKNKGGPMPRESIDTLALWIEQGAVWPDGLKLVPKKVEEAGGDDLAAVRAIHQKILANLSAKSQEEMKAYSNSIPGTAAGYAMVPIPGGEYLMGSPESERGHRPDESPQHKVILSPFWMGKYEVTWNEYELFMYTDQEKVMTVETNNPYLDGVSDAVSRPTKPYVEMSFGMGKGAYPAICMTQHAANKYCEWLSAKTGHYYRLPTEAEWEYACRAGTTTAYFFGDDPSQLGEYAWYAKNSDFKYQKVGRKSPNPWGLHDIYGNVIEWCLDQFEPDAYRTFLPGPVKDPWLRATKPYPHVVRGGHWDDEDIGFLRSAARRGSSRDWKVQDPQLPKSVWYHTDAQWLGFRIVRPLNVPPPEELLKVWNSGVEKD